MADTVSRGVVVARKRALRAQMIACRAAQPAEQRAIWSAAILLSLGSSSRWRAARCIGLFHAMDDEVATHAMIRLARAEGRRVALPVVVAPRRPLAFRDATDPACPLVRSRFGAWEPAPSATEVPLHAIDLFVVPGLAFDRHGHRLGYGAGFYDRTLASSRAPRVMVAYALQEVERIPTEDHDETMDAVVTENGWTRPEGSMLSPCR